MQSNIIKNIEKIYSELTKLSSFAKSILKYGTQISLLLLAIGTALVIYNHTGTNFSEQFEFVAISIVKVSFTIEAEVIIGSLIIDFVLKKN
jgi:hypothetical protein